LSVGQNYDAEIRRASMFARLDRGFEQTLGVTNESTHAGTYRPVRYIVDPVY
jgi:hypothetical protein